MMEDLNPTTRMFPRTTRDAFQDEADWFELPDDKLSLWDWGVIVVSLCLWFGLVWYWSRM